MVSTNTVKTLILGVYRKLGVRSRKEAVRIARMGPLQGVAEALDETPSQSRMPELWSMAAAVQDARGS